MHSKFEYSRTLAGILLAAMVAHLSGGRLAGQDLITVTLEPVRDNTIYSEADESNGQGSYLFAGRTRRSERRRALLAFNLEGVVPPGATIQSASFTLHMNKTTAGAATIGVHAVQGDWGEGGSNAALEEGSGIAAQAGDATWRHTRFPDSLWSIPGGDFSASSSATTSVTGVGFYTWSGAGIVADVQAWVDSPAQNFGWIVVGPESAVSTKRFDSRHATAAANRPKLVIQFEAPTPSYREQWIEQYFGAGAQVDFDGDSDLDGLSDRHEYAFGFNPTSPTSKSGMRFEAPVDTTKRLKAIFRRDPRADDVIFRVEVSGNLEAWETIAESVDGETTAGPATIVEEALADADGVLRVTVTDTVPPTSDSHRFLRLVILDQP